jgi:hypothetical protein
VATGFWIFLVLVIATSVAAFFTPRFSLATLIKIALIPAIIVAVVIGIKVLQTPSLEDATRVDCINNLRQIDSAKEQWAIAKRAAPGTPIDEAAVDAFIKGGRPECRGKGTYRYGNVGETPTCSLPSHKLQ